MYPKLKILTGAEMLEKSMFWSNSSRSHSDDDDCSTQEGPLGSTPGFSSEFDKG
jgi:hypothetical protein